MKWAVGDKVMAKWPGSALYFLSKVTAINADDTADVLFEDGTKMEIAMKYIKSEGSFAQRRRSKSPARSRRRSRSRSPARSPARKGQVIKKSGGTPKSQRSSFRGRNKVSFSPDIKKDEVNSEKQQKQVTTEKTVTTTKIAHSTVELSSSASIPTYRRYMMTRQLEKEILSSPVAKSQNEVSSQTKEQTSYPVEYGGTFGVFLTYLTAPIIPLLLLLACTERDCSISKFKLSMIPLKWQAYFNVRSFVVVLSFMLFHAVIYALPLGYIIKGPPTPNGNRLNYRISAPYTLLLTGATYAVAVFRYKVSFSFVHDELFRMAVVALVVSYIGTLLLHISSFWAKKSELNPSGNTGSHLYDSFIGRVLHPRIGELFDLKLYLYRPTMAGWLVLILVEMERHYNMRGTFSTQFLIIALSQIVYIFFAFFYDEAQCPYMYDIKNDALGFPQFYGELVVVPFLYSFPVRYVMNYPSHLSIPMLVMIATFLVTGYILVFWSGRQKALFRMDPFDSKVSTFQSIPSTNSQGSRILVSGLWGFVRHPNYLGEILIGIAFGLTCGFQHFLPWFYPIFVTFLLCHRSLRDDVCCRRKHGQAWKVYCDSVKYRVIPGVF